MDKIPSIVVTDDQSIFTSPFFTAWKDYFAAAGLRMPKFNAQHDDLLLFLREVCLCLSPSYVGIDSRLGDIRFEVDGTNLALAKTAYWALTHRMTAEHYFPTADLFQALQDTDIQWVDFDIWKTLPDVINLRVPTRNKLQCNIMGKLFSVDDIFLGRATMPQVREHYALIHGHDLTPESEVWFWLTQSRDETSQMLQNSTFGSLIVDRHTKLEDLLAQLVKFAVDTDIAIGKQIDDEHLVDVIDSNQSEATSRLGRQHAEYVKGMFMDRKERPKENYRHYRAILEFVLKFVTLMATDQFKRIPIPIPGFKSGKTSVKAKAIQQKLFERYGNRFQVVMPPAQEPPVEEEGTGEHGTHRSPMRHLVKGFFRQQPYGPQRSLRKTVWIMPFFRGSVVVGS